MNDAVDPPPRLAPDGTPSVLGPAEPPSRPSEPWVDSALDDFTGRRDPPPMRWLGWRMRMLVAAALLASVGLFSLARYLAAQPHVDAVWRADPGGGVVLAITPVDELQPLQGRGLLGVSAGSLRVDLHDALVLQRSARWLMNDADRARHRALHEQLDQALHAPSVTFHFADGEDVRVAPQPRGFGGLPAIFWPLLGFSLCLFLVAVMVPIAQPSATSLLYAVMGCCQAGNLLFIAVEATLGLGLPGPFPRLDAPLRMAFDLVTTAAMVHAAALHPRRLPHAGRVALAGWALAGALLFAFLQGVPGAWWAAQAGTTGLSVAAIGLLGWSYRLEPHPVAMMLRRFSLAAIGSWLLLNVALVATAGRAGVPHNLAAIGSMVWYVFAGSLLLLSPFLVKSHVVLRELSLLAAISTIATSLDLLFVAVFSLGQFASLSLSLLVSLAVYSGARQWIVQQLRGESALSTGRMFERLYRMVREVELRPERAPVLLSQLLGELFQPTEVQVVAQHTAAATVAGDGSALLVPVPALAGDDQPAGSVLIRFAHHGRRLFTRDDARLMDRVVEQLSRAVAYDQAVEQGRKEERARLAQDLHDDIGARLLTLMYTAHSPEMEDYLRHTLQDLKTLTRGLAAANHRLSHAAAEWKADITQRLVAAQIELRWAVSFDDDVLLTVVQWSGLTRVLRELVSNVIAHSQASRVEIELLLARGRLELLVADDGVGRTPGEWSHGLGLGGVRKRVKQLGGEVQWRETSPRGIACRVVIRRFLLTP